MAVSLLFGNYFQCFQSLSFELQIQISLEEKKSAVGETKL